MSDIRALEYGTLRVPYEVLNKDFRAAQKVIDRESGHVAHALADLDKLLQAEGKAADVSTLAPSVRSLRDKLLGLCDRLEQSVGAELASTDLIAHRVQHLQTPYEEAASAAGVHNWKRGRIERLVVDYLLRAGYYETAAAMANKCGLARLVNVDIFVRASRVAAALLHAEPAACLGWCHENKSKLRRVGSRLELLVRQQEFVEMVRAGKKLPAVQYARRWLSAKESWRGSAGSQLKRAMALLAFASVDNVPAAYRDLLAADRWQTLVEIFWDTFYSVYSLPPIGAFSACLQCGLTALKTPHCAPRFAYDAPSAGQLGAAGRGCPVCQPDMHALAANLPYAHVSHSRLICPFSGEPMTEENVPMMLPNGWVYGKLTLGHLAALNALDGGGGGSRRQSATDTSATDIDTSMEGIDTVGVDRGGRKPMVTCPKTGMTYPLDSALRVFVM